MDVFKETINEIGNQILNSTAEIGNVIDLLLSSKKIFVYGAGRSGFIGKCFAQRLMHLCLNVHFVGEATTPSFGEDDVLVVISGSGETSVPVLFAEKAKKSGGKIIAFTSKPDSTIGRIADEIVLVKGKSKGDKISSLAPYTSLFDITALAFCDGIARVLMDKLGVGEDLIDKTHANLE